MDTPTLVPLIPTLTPTHTPTLVPLSPTPTHTPTPTLAPLRIKGVYLHVFSWAQYFFYTFVNRFERKLPCACFMNVFIKHYLKELHFLALAPEKTIPALIIAG